MTPANLKAMYKRWLLELWDGDLEVVEEIVTDDFAIHHGEIQPGTGREMRGPEGLKKLVSMTRDLFTELSFAIEVGPIAEGDLVAARWTGRGRYAGGIPGATAPVGTEVTFSGHDILRAASGRFAEYWVSSDESLLMRQLGVEG